MENLKLYLRKAIFAGKTFAGHCEKVGEILDQYTDEEVENLFESDDDAMKLLVEWEDLREHLGITGV